MRNSVLCYRNRKRRLLCSIFFKMHFRQFPQMQNCIKKTSKFSGLKFKSYPSEIQLKVEILTIGNNLVFARRLIQKTLAS